MPRPNFRHIIVYNNKNLRKKYHPFQQYIEFMERVKKNANFPKGSNFEQLGLVRNSIDKHPIN